MIKGFKKINTHYKIILFIISDLGVHIDGYIALVAHTVICQSN